LRAVGVTAVIRAGVAAAPASDAIRRSPVDLAAMLIIAATTVLTGLFCLDRERFNLGLESDFIGRFLPEAQRFLDGGPLVVDIHPPGYPIVLAVGNLLTGDWMTSGLVLSWLASVAVLVCCWRLFAAIGGPWAGLCAVGLLATSSRFLAFSVQAGSDMVFLAAYCGTLLAVVHAMASPRRSAWFVGGLLAGTTVLMRANGVLVLLLALAPLLTPMAARARVWSGSLFVAGMLLPVLLWAGFATATHSPVFPTETHSNLAMTFYGDRGTAPHDQRIRMAQKFDSSLDVLFSDPVHILRTYVTDLVKLPGRVVPNAGWAPLSVLAALCLLYLAPWLRSRRALVVLGMTVLSVLLINLMQFQARFYMHVTPVLGGALGMATAAWLARSGGGRGREMACLAALAAAFLAGSVPAARAARAMAEPPVESQEIASLVAAVRAHVPAGAPLVARKNLIAFYTGRPLIWFPEARSLEEICSALAGGSRGPRVYVVIGGAERRIRREVAEQVLAGDLPAWARVLEAGGPAQDRWALAELSLAGCHVHAGASGVGRP